MRLTREQFNVLEIFSSNTTPLTRERLEEGTGYSPDRIHRLLEQLVSLGYVEDGVITGAGLEALEPYRAKRAIFLAAGMGERLIPITLNTPKPLVRVNGTRIIDTLLDAVIAAGIEEIYIVRGYLGEQFDQLLQKYPMIRFVENPIFNEANNISSAMCVRHLLQNAYVLEADLMLYNPALIRKYQYASNYLGVPVERTDDWCLVTKDDAITSLKIGGTNCFHEYGISYWNERDGLQLCEDIKTVYEMPGGKERFWDQAPLEYCIDRYRVEVRQCTFQDIVEIDSFSDLKKLDKAYQTNG